VKNVFNMVKSHEQGVLTRFVWLYSLELMLDKISRFLELWIINYELLTSYPRLTIKYVINTYIKLIYNFISEIMFKFKLWI
jgi:hypothetical protein